jgi:hypothetical protein
MRRKPRPPAPDRRQRVHVQAMADALVALHAMAAEINAGGEVYPAGVRAVARDVMRDCEGRGFTLTTIRGRT